MAVATWLVTIFAGVLIGGSLAPYVQGLIGLGNPVSLYSALDAPTDTKQIILLALELASFGLGLSGVFQSRFVLYGKS